MEGKAEGRNGKVTEGKRKEGCPSIWKLWIRQWTRGGREKGKDWAWVEASRHFFFHFKYALIIYQYILTAGGPSYHQ